ncbi:hypothetical protein [Streptomyces sp. NPDC101206]|uniref:hypothetical protein n=1 Tax=Streptomyces sp. NPDC101206 TaxID=3366128 RepID=UPI003830A71F
MGSRQDGGEERQVLTHLPKDGIRRPLVVAAPVPLEGALQVGEIAGAVGVQAGVDALMETAASFASRSPGAQPAVSAVLLERSY